MNPIISSIDENENEMSFTLSNINVSIANALRRSLLDNIDMHILHIETAFINFYINKGCSEEIFIC